MRRFTIQLLGAILLIGVASQARAQYVPGAIPAGMDRRNLFKDTGANPGRNDNTKGDSPKEKKRKDAKKKYDDSTTDANKAKKAYDDHVKRMENDNANRGMTRSYVPGWVRYPDGLQKDPRYDDLKNAADKAVERQKSAKGEYNSVP